ncbi:MAG TPA: hypothetical protein VFN21_07510 [Acidimicrobiales bacterium]|nr:hypothetical protein [Acidimicrobiales bacterium]
MSSTPRTRPSIRRGILALSVTSMLTLASCGGGGGDTSDSEQDKRSTTVAAASEKPTSSTDASTTSAEAVAILPVGGEAPEGYRLGDASCDADGAQSDDTETDDTKRPTWIVYGVPEGWDAQGYSGGGSGGPQDSQELTFDTDGGNSSDGRVKIGVEWDSRMPDGTVLDVNGDPFESFDYDIEYMTEPEKNARITYDEVASVEVGDDSADLFFQDPAQNPEELGTTMQYKARVLAYELPKSSAELDETSQQSFVVTFEFDSEDVDLTQDDVEKILGSFTIPECTWDKVLADAELRLGVDLDGDGHARNAEDAQEEMQEKLDAMRDNLPPEAQKQYDDMREQLESDN